MQGFVFISFIFISLFNARFRSHLVSYFWGFLGSINDLISKCELVFFSHFRINVTKMWVHGEADCFWFIWPPFSGWLQKFRNSDIVSLARPRGILEPPSVVFSVCQNLYQKLVFCWHVYDRCTSCKFINWYADLTIWMLEQCTAFWIWIIII